MHVYTYRKNKKRRSTAAQQGHDAQHAWMWKSIFCSPQLLGVSIGMSKPAGLSEDPYYVVRE